MKIKEIQGKYVSISPQEFLAEHLPNHHPNMPKVEKKSFKKVAQQSKETAIYPAMVRLSTVNFCPF